MIQSIRIRGFKRFVDTTIDLTGRVVLAGPNNTGKTSVLQAIAAWKTALQRWREVNDYRMDSGFKFAPIARQAFTPVPLRSFDLLWNDLNYTPKNNIEIGISHRSGWKLTMEFKSDNTEAIYVRPKLDTPVDLLRNFKMDVVFIRPMAGVCLDEPVYMPAKIEYQIALGQSGDILRNLIAEAYIDKSAWKEIQSSLEKLFGYELLPPDASLAHIRADYRSAISNNHRRPQFDLACAGSGFHQVLLLLVLLNVRRGAVFLLDEPDAHLHVILEDSIYYELRKVAAEHGSQLIIATHSEVLIDSVEPRDLRVMLDRPRVVADTTERKMLIASLRVLSNTEIMQANSVCGVLYVEDYTDCDILRAWATVLCHPAEKLMATSLMWKQAVFQTREGGVGNAGIRARDHFRALQMVRPDIPGLELVDGDAHSAINEMPVTGKGLQRLRWRRYEIESYLLHPDALSRFVTDSAAPSQKEHCRTKMLAHWRNEFPLAIVREPLSDHVVLNQIEARTKFLPPLLTAGGITDLPYTRYFEIALSMRPSEIHPEVVEKLDAICKAFGYQH